MDLQCVVLSGVSSFAQVMDLSHVPLTGWCGFRERFLMASQPYSYSITMGLLLHTFLSTVPHTHTLHIVLDFPPSLWLLTGTVLLFFPGLIPSPIPDMLFALTHLPEACTELCLWHGFGKRRSFRSHSIGCRSCDQKKALVGTRSSESSYHPS